MNAVANTAMLIGGISLATGVAGATVGMSKPEQRDDGVTASELKDVAIGVAQWGGGGAMVGGIGILAG